MEIKKRLQCNAGQAELATHAIRGRHPRRDARDSAVGQLAEGDGALPCLSLDCHRLAGERVPSIVDSYWNVSGM